MPTNLPRESFIALAAVAWADGRMTAIESKGLVHAAKTLGLAGDDLAAVERAAASKVSMSDFDATGLTTWDRLLTFGLASWLSRLDGTQQTAEIESLRALSDKLASDEVTDHRLRAAAAVAFNVATLPEGRRPDRYDFATFESQLRERLPAIG